MRKFLNIFKFTFFFLLTIAVLDIFIRFARIESLAKTEIDPERGKILKPNQYSVYFNEGFYVGKPNIHGFYGPDYPVYKDQNTFRIALLGDSYVAATQLFERYHFRTLLEDSLRKKTGQNVEILNFGRAGFDFKDMYCLYENFIKDFSPDIALFFLGKNDFLNDHKDPLLPECVIDSDGEIKIETDFTNKKAYKKYQKLSFFADNSSLIKLITNCKKFFDKGETGRILFDKFYIKTETKTENILTKENKFVLSELNLKIIEKLIKHRTIIIMRNEFPAELTDIFSSGNIRAYKIFEIFDEMERNGTDHIYWNVTGKRGHWNHEAHERIAEYLTEILTDYIEEEDGLE